MSSNICAEIKNLKVSFKGREILHNISTRFESGKITVLIGRSGAGKTTLLRAVNRLNEVFDGCRTSGEVVLELKGLKTSVYDSRMALPQLRRSAGILFQTPNPLPMTLIKNITLPLELARGISHTAAVEKAEQMLRTVGLYDEVKDRLNVPASELSGGQQQRMCLARVLALEPELLLLDEPTASLDRKSSEIIEDCFTVLKKDIPIIMVSHSLAQSVKLGDSFKIMRDGNIVKEVESSDLPQGTFEKEKYLEELL